MFVVTNTFFAEFVMSKRKGLTEAELLKIMENLSDIEILSEDDLDFLEESTSQVKIGDDNNNDEFGDNEEECIANEDEDVDYDTQDVQNKINEIKEGDQEKKSSFLFFQSFSLIFFFT
ncbi:hypothetical protein JTB14_023744 [Gonioctena quinquepunctata]|nr:hypothetical protein JTB14_023744 [Gonioctena quinquepunctata]